jgi:hypothetical protein
MMRWEVLLHPNVYAEAIAAHPPLGAATLLLLTLAAFWAQIMGWADALLQRKFEGIRKELMGMIGITVGVALSFLTIWILLTFLTLGILRWLGHPLSFEALFCLLVIATLPKFAVWFTCPVRELSLRSLYVWRILAALSLPYMTLRIWETMGAAGSLHGWQTLLTVAPLLTALLAVSIWEIFAFPNSLQAAYPWRRAIGKRVVVFYPPGKAAAEAQAIAHAADALVSQIERILDVRAVPFRIGIFLCLNPEDLRRLNKEKGLVPGRGYAYAAYISLLYGPWTDIQATVAHELTHTVAKQRLNLHVMPLLNEGLAEYGRAQTGAGSDAAICLPLPLGTLAHRGLFYEWCYVEEPDYPWQAQYAHAAALTDYLIGRYGIAKFKELCRQTAYDSKQNPAAQLHKAVAGIYGLSLRQLEQNWRREWVGPGEIEREEGLPDSGQPPPPHS